MWCMHIRRAGPLSASSRLHSHVYLVTRMHWKTGEMTPERFLMLMIVREHGGAYLRFVSAQVRSMTLHHVENMVPKRAIALEWRAGP